jgi:hypothetical protein
VNERHDRAPRLTISLGYQVDRSASAASESVGSTGQISSSVDSTIAVDESGAAPDQRRVEVDLAGPQAMPLRMGREGLEPSTDGL